MSTNLFRDGDSAGTGVASVSHVALNLTANRRVDSNWKLGTAVAHEILLSIEITKSSSDTQDFPYEKDNANATVCVLRLLKPWFHSNRHVCADSYFSSVPTAEKLWEVGLRFSGRVKAATRLYPMNHLSDIPLPGTTPSWFQNLKKKAIHLWHSVSQTEIGVIL